MHDLTPFVRHHIERLFPRHQHDEVAALLYNDCGRDLPGAGSGPSAMPERVQCAALRFSEGRLDKLYDAVALAQTDWRDLLVAAGFADDPQAHTHRLDGLDQAT